MNAVTSEEIRSTVSQLQNLNQYRRGRKTALVCPQDLAFGMMRMFQIMVEDKVEVQVNVFRSVDEGMEWISAQPDA